MQQDQENIRTVAYTVVYLFTVCEKDWWVADVCTQWLIQRWAISMLLWISILFASSVDIRDAWTTFKSHSARTGRTVFSQLLAAVVRHEANDGVVCAISAWFKQDTALSGLV